jgi:DNA-binding transcriptional MocR family regulator
VVNLFDLRLDATVDTPIYKQLADSISDLIVRDVVKVGERLPATRELAGRLGLNRTTVSAAYGLLEQMGLIHGHVGRGSFVALRPGMAVGTGLDWESLLPPLDARQAAGPSRPVDINFATARPARDAFPLSQFRRLAKQVIDGPDAPEILQLGSPHGFGPLRRYLLEQAIAAGIARSGDDLMITNGCQQALDLLARLLITQGESAAVEDPVYYGLVRVFVRAGARIVPVPVVDEAGLDADALEETLRRERPRALVVTPSFQNPTGATLPLARRRRIVELAQRYGIVLVENDIYSELRYHGSPLPTLKQLDETQNTILVGSYSKVSFPGLRVGWVIGPRAVLARLVEVKEGSDLHSDQLSQAVLLRFAESGELARHLQRTRHAGAERLNVALQACGRFLPAGTKFTRPEGGMNLWIELPAPLTAERLLARVQDRGVSFLPGRYFSARGAHTRGLRICFGGLPPEQIARGIQVLGETASQELAVSNTVTAFEPAAALV